MTLALNFQEQGTGVFVSAFNWREQLTDNADAFLSDCESVRSHRVEGGTLIVYPVQHAPIRLYFGDWFVVWQDGFIERVEDKDFREFFEKRLSREDLMRLMAEEDDEQLEAIRQEEEMVLDSQREEEALASVDWDGTREGREQASAPLGRLLKGET